MCGKDTKIRTFFEVFHTFLKCSPIFAQNTPKIIFFEVFRYLTPLSPLNLYKSQLNQTQDDVQKPNITKVSQFHRVTKIKFDLFYVTLFVLHNFWWQIALDKIRNQWHCPSGQTIQDIFRIPQDTFWILPGLYPTLGTSDLKSN